MLVKINVLTCDYIDFHKLAISQDKKLVKLMSMYSHVSTLMHYWQKVLKVMGITGGNQCRLKDSQILG